MASKITVYPSGRVAAIIAPATRGNMEKRVDRIVAAAKNYSPVKTGRMRRSIHARYRGGGGQFVAKGGGAVVHSYEVVVAVPYAIYVIKGTRYIRPNPFIEKALRAGMQ